MKFFISQWCEEGDELLYIGLVMILENGIAEDIPLNKRRIE